MNIAPSQPIAIVREPCRGSPFPAQTRGVLATIHDRMPIFACSYTAYPLDIAGCD